MLTNLHFEMINLYGSINIYMYDNGEYDLAKKRTNNNNWLMIEKKNEGNKQKNVEERM